MRDRYGAWKSLHRGGRASIPPEGEGQMNPEWGGICIPPEGGGADEARGVEGHAFPQEGGGQTAEVPLRFK